MKRRVINENNRKKAFIGSIIGAVANVTGDIIKGVKEKKIAKKTYEANQINQTHDDGIKQAAAISAQYANQGYVDEYKNKIALRNGGKINMKDNNRVKINKKIRLGGGGDVFGIGDAINGLGSIVTAAMKSTKVNNIQKGDGFSYGNPKTNIKSNNYQTDNDTNNIFDTTDKNMYDRIKMAKMGIRCKAKCGGKCSK